MFLLRNTDILRLREEVERFIAAFASYAALLHPAKWHTQIAHEPAIHPDGPGVDLLRDAVCAVQILGPNTRREPVITVVGVMHDLLFAIERSNRNDGPEDLFAIGAA